MTRAELRQLGAALGAASGPVGAYGQAWSGIGDGGLHVAVLFTLVGALLGALTLPLFLVPATADGDARPPGPAFGALFGFAVGVVGGAFAAFPMGAVMGSLGGAVGGAFGAFVWRRLGPGRVRVPLTALAAAGAAFLVIWIWISA